MNKLSIDVGIPAYNEEVNIRKLIKSILLQKEDIFVLNKIIIISDCSTDSTVQEVKIIQDLRVVLLENSNRLGKSESQNKIVEQSNSDLLLLLDADVLINDEYFIAKLIKPFIDKKNIGIVCPAVKHVNGRNFFERVLNYSVLFKKSVFMSWRNGNNLFMCVGVARVFSRGFISNFVWDSSVIAEDAFSYLGCVSRKFDFIYNPEAEIYIKSPDNFKDHMNQSSRFLDAKKAMKAFFSDDLIESEYSIPFSIMLKNLIKYFFRNPIYFISYIFIFALVKIHPNRKKYIQAVWEQAASSKVIE